jgi:RNA polymerase sigma-70 factor (ECF subfamily)
LQARRESTLPTSFPQSDDTARDLAAETRIAEDERLVRGVLAGDREATEEFARRSRLIAGVLATLNGSRGRSLDAHDLADVEQDTVLLVWKKLPDYRPIAPLEHWMYGIARFTFQNALRRKLRGRNQQIAAERAARETADEVEPSSIDADDVQAALEEIDPEDAWIVRLRGEEELSFLDIARRVGVPENTVKTRFRRARLRVVEILVRLRRLEGGR